MMPTAAATMPAWRIWFLATRPWSLTISVVPILLAFVMAWEFGEFSIVYGLMMLLCSVATHIACNFTNDYFDDASGVDLVQNEGQGRMLQDGHLNQRDLRPGMIVAFAMALAFGIPIIARLGWPGLVFALIGGGVAYLYTGGPWPLAYNRMGEIGVFTAMGLVMVGGAFYVHTGTMTPLAWIISIGVGLYAAAILHANNMRDIEVDAMHNKHTLANTFGWDRGVQEYAALVFAPIGLVVVLVMLTRDHWLLLAVLLVIPSVTAAINHMRTAGKGNLTSAIVGLSTKLHMRFGLLTMIALIITGLIR